MPNLTGGQLKKFRLYALATIPFIALFAFELATVLLHRPSAPDLIHGYTIAIGSEGDGKPVYFSAGDLALILGPFLCGFAIQVVGLWRIGLFQRLRRV